jgi:hypothetical protein
MMISMDHLRNVGAKTIREDLEGAPFLAPNSKNGLLLEKVTLIFHSVITEDAKLEICSEEINCCVSNQFKDEGEKAEALKQRVNAAVFLYFATTDFYERHNSSQEREVTYAAVSLSFVEGNMFCTREYVLHGKPEGRIDLRFSSFFNLPLT